MIKTRIENFIDLCRSTSGPEWDRKEYESFKAQKEDLEKDLEVLDILKNKNKDIHGLIYAIRNEEKLKDKYKYESSLDFYNKSVPITPEAKLTQEEFDKLAEWVKRNNMI